MAAQLGWATGLDPHSHSSHGDVQSRSSLGTLGPSECSHRVPCHWPCRSNFHLEKAMGPEQDEVGGSPTALLWIVAMVVTLFQSSSHCASSPPKDSRKRQDVK